MYKGVLTLTYIHEGQRTTCGSQFPPLTLCFMGLELRSSGLAASTFTL